MTEHETPDPWVMDAFERVLKLAANPPLTLTQFAELIPDPYITELDTETADISLGIGEGGARLIALTELHIGYSVHWAQRMIEAAYTATKTTILDAPGEF